MSSELISTIQKQICQELRSSSNNYTNIKTIYLRVLKEIASLMGVTFEDIYKLKECLFVHEHCSEKVLDVLGLPMSDDERQTLENFVSKDYLKVNEIMKTVNVLSKLWKDTTKLNHLLAMDGLKGTDPRKYFENLKYPFFGEGTSDPRELHVRAIRTIYSTLPPIPQSFDIVYSVIFECFKTAGISLPEEPRMSAENIQKWTQTYMTLVGEDAFKEIVNLTQKNKIIKKNTD